jgi:hypothetical protein
MEMAKTRYKYRKLVNKFSSNDVNDIYEGANGNIVMEEHG